MFMKFEEHIKSGGLHNFRRFFVMFPQCHFPSNRTSSGQCKHCPVYQYMTGCVQLSPWQLADLEVSLLLSLSPILRQANRRAAELRMRRVGAELLCEDSYNQTTCICNRRDKCNSIHARLPFSTYADGLFKGVVDFDQVIGALDPRSVSSSSSAKYENC